MRRWLKTLRNEKNLTMKYVADKLGISESYYCAIENEDRQKDMCISLAHGLATIFDISVDQISQYEREEVKKKLSAPKSKSKSK